MPLITTPALVLHVIPYGDTSKIVKLLTRDLGIVSGIAKGARRARARTGPRLDLFAAGSATLMVRPTRDLHPLTAFELTTAHAALAYDMTRFAAASALVELALRCAPLEPHPEIHEAVGAGLEAIEQAPAELAGSVALLAAWGVVAALGFAPALERCVVCDTEVGDDLAFSVEQGGALCGAHRGGMRTSRLSPGDAGALASLTAGRLPEPPLDPRHEAAHRRLLLGFIRHHLAEHREMPALAFWDSEAWNATSS